MSKFLEKDTYGNWNTIPPVPVEKVKNVNCHKFVLYGIGTISWQEMVSDPREQKDKGIDFTFEKKIRLISDTPYTFISDEESLNLLAQDSCEISRVYVGQIFDVPTKETTHSFLVKRESEEKYLCFDKPGFIYPFTVSNLTTILNFVNKDGHQSNKNQNWRFILLESIKKLGNSGNLKVG